MRLTVHLSNVEKGTVEVKTKEGYVNKKKTFNTLSFSDINPNEVDGILNKLKSEGAEIKSSYVSGQKILGHVRTKKK